MSLFAGLLQDSRGSTCSNAGIASASSLALPDADFNLSLASSRHDARHRVESAAPVSSSVPRTFCRGSTRSLANIGNKHGPSTLSKAGASLFALDSESGATKAGSYCLQSLQLGPLQISAAAPAYKAVPAAADHNGSAAKALTFHQLQLSTAKQTRLGGLPTDQVSDSTSLLLTAGQSSKVRQLHEASNEIAVLDTVAARGLLRHSDMTRDNNATSLQPRPAAALAAAVAEAASTGQQAEASDGLQDLSGGVWQKTQQNKLQLQSRPPKARKHTSSVGSMAPPSSEAAAVASKLETRHPKLQEIQEKGFQLTEDLFAAGTGSVATALKPALATAGARSHKLPVERLRKGCLLLPLPCSISSSSIACGGANAKLQGATAGRSTGAGAEECQQTAGCGVAGREAEITLGPSRTLKQQGLIGRRQAGQKQQAPSAFDSATQGPGGRNSTGDQQQQQEQRLMQMQQGTDTRQQHKRHKSMLCNNHHAVACTDSEIQEPDLLDSYQTAGDKQYDKLQQQQVATAGRLQPHLHALQRSGRTRQRQQQCKHTGACDSEPDSEFEPAGSSSPSADISSEWSGGGSGTASASSDSNPASKCSTADSGRNAKPSKASTSSRNARNVKAPSSMNTSVLRNRSASAAAAATPADAVQQDAGTNRLLQLQLPGMHSAAAAATHAAGFPQQQQQRKRAVTWSLLPLPGQQQPADLTPIPAGAAAANSDERICLEKQLQPGPPAAAAAALDAKLRGGEAVVHPRGHIRLIQPSAAALSRQNVLLIELPPCFDAAGDAGSIGRIVCSRQDRPNDASRDLAAGPAVGTYTGTVGGSTGGLQLLLPQLGVTSSSNPTTAAVKLAATGLDYDAVKQHKMLDASKRKAQQLLVGWLGDTLSEDGNSSFSDTESQGGTHSDRSESDSLAHAGEYEESDEEGTDSDKDAAAVAADDREVTAVQLDLKGLIFSAVNLPLAGTAAVVRINMAGGNQAKASAQVEHLFNTSYIRAIAAADTACDAGDPYAAGMFADDSDGEGQEGIAHLMAQDAYRLAAGFRDEDVDVGHSSRSAGVGCRARGGKSKKGGKSRGGGRSGTKSKPAGGGKEGSKARSTARGRGASARGVNGSKRGRGASAGAVEAKPAAKKQKQLEAWEVSDGDDE